MNPSPTATDAPTAGVSDEISEGLARIEAVFDELEGLVGDERRERLASLAAEEGGLVVMYGSPDAYEVDPMLRLFEERYDITPNYYRSPGDPLAQKVVEEVRAGFSNGADVVIVNASGQLLFDELGYITPIGRSPIIEELADGVVFENWVGAYVNAYTMSYNTNSVTDPPQTWDELLTDFEGTLAFDIGSWDWLYAVTTGYFIPELNMTEDEVVTLLKETMARDSTVLQDGTNLIAELMAAGEYDASPTTYTNAIDVLAKNGAPVAWANGPEPLFLRPIGISIIATTPRPASALLLWEHMLSAEAQAFLIDVERTPANVNVTGGGLPADIATTSPDLVELQENSAHWQSLWEEILASN